MILQGRVIVRFQIKLIRKGLLKWLEGIKVIKPKSQFFELMFDDTLYRGSMSDVMEAVFKLENVNIK